MVKASITLLGVGGVSFSGDVRVHGNTNLLKDVKIEHLVVAMATNQSPYSLPSTKYLPRIRKCQ